ncbi:MAG: hypothetical protein ACK53D_01265 [Pseudanabaena sp.]
MLTMPLVKSPTNIDTVTIILSLRQITPTTRAIASPISRTAMELVRISSHPTAKPMIKATESRVSLAMMEILVIPMTTPIS